MNYSTKTINSSFRIKVSGTSFGRKVNVLVGVSGLYRIVGDNIVVENLIEKAFKKGEDKVIFKLRRGLKITFYSK